MNYQEIDGDLIELALKGEFDIIAHGCNCFCTMGAGIAPKMAKTFGCDKYPMEQSFFKGDINKLGSIDYETLIINSETLEISKYSFSKILPPKQYLEVVNAYIQYRFNRNYSNGVDIPLDYEALTLCMRKMNHQFRGLHIGLPQIGCGLAGGNWNIVKTIIQKELKNCNVTIVIFK